MKDHYNGRITEDTTISFSNRNEKFIFSKALELKRGCNMSHVIGLNAGNAVEERFVLKQRIQ